MTDCAACAKALKDLKVVASLLRMALDCDDSREEIEEAFDRVLKILTHYEKE